MILHLQVPEISDIVEKVDGLTSLSVSLWIAQLASQRFKKSVIQSIYQPVSRSYFAKSIYR